MNLGLFVIVLLFGALGSLLRYLLGRAWPAREGRVPAGTLAANLLGSFLGGLILGILGFLLLGTDLAHAVFAGFCGGLTTFSTWAVDVVLAVRAGHRLPALLNILVTLIGAIVLFAAGYLVPIVLFLRVIG